MAPTLEANEIGILYKSKKAISEDQIIQMLTGPLQTIKLNDPYQLITHLRRRSDEKLDQFIISILNSIPKIKLDLSARRFGSFGGRYAPELQMESLSDIATHFGNAVSDIKFWKEFVSCIFKPSPLQLAKNLTQHARGANIWLKREDTNQFGSHKIRNIVGQVLLAVRMGKTEIVMDCGYAGHGLVCAALCEKLSLKCTIFMGMSDANAQKQQVALMQQLGAMVAPSENGLSCYTIRAAIDDAHRHVVSHDNAYYIPSGPIGPHPLPLIHRTFQSLMGEETKDQFFEMTSKLLPDAVVAPVGMGSGAVGMFAPFIEHPSVQLFGVQPAGAAPLTSGSVGVLYGACTYLLQDQHGQVLDGSSCSKDLTCPTVGPELAHWKETDRVEYVEIGDDNAIDNMLSFHNLEGFLPAFATGYAIDKAIQLAKELGPGKDVVLLVSGEFKRSGELEV